MNKIKNSIVLTLILMSFGCGEDGLVDLKDKPPFPTSEQKGLSAVNFPTPSGGSWTYREVETGREVTMKIGTTRHVDAFTYWQMIVDEVKLFELTEPFELILDRLANGFNAEVDVAEATEILEAIKNFELSEELETLRQEIIQLVDSGEFAKVSDLEPIENGDKSTDDETGEIDLIGDTKPPTNVNLGKIIDLTVKILMAEFESHERSLVSTFTVDKDEEERIWRIPIDIQHPYVIRRTKGKLTVFANEAVDHLSANGLVFRQRGAYMRSAALPIFSTYFIKNAANYREAAFDIFLSTQEVPVIHQKHFTLRKFWDFPLAVGKKWTVFKTATFPTIEVIRQVVSENESVNVPADTLGRSAYLIEEEIREDLPDAIENDENEDPSDEEEIGINPARFWVVEGVGVVKYEYDEFLTARDVATHHTFELIDYYLP